MAVTIDFQSSPSSVNFVEYWLHSVLGVSGLSAVGEGSFSQLHWGGGLAWWGGGVGE